MQDTPHSAIRRRIKWHGLLPRWDRRGLWPVKRWLWWVWDFPPATTARHIDNIIDELRTRPTDLGAGPC
jgi:hypothetical protein